MATKAEAVEGKPFFPAGDLYNCRRASRVASLLWPFRRRHSKMFHTDSSSLPKLNSIPSSSTDENGPKSAPSSPVSAVKRFCQNDKKIVVGDFSSWSSSYPSSCCSSSGYSSGYSSGDSATTESDLLNSAIAKVSATEIGSSGLLLQPNAVKILSKKRNSEDNSKFLSTTQSTSASCPSESDSLLPDSSVNYESTTGEEVTVEDDLPEGGGGGGVTGTSCPKRSASSISSITSSEVSAEDSPRRRVRDDEGFIRRAACVCVNDDETKVVLISSKNSGGGWLVPGGGLEEDEEESTAAQREAWEEAGVTGDIRRRLGIFQMEDGESHKRKRTAVYVLKVSELHSTFPEASLGRVRQWYSIESAISHLSQCKPHQIAYLRALQLAPAL